MPEYSKVLDELWILWQFGNWQELGGWSYVVLAVLVALEGPIATMLGAAAAAAGWLNPVLVFVAASVGNTVADALWYLLGYSGRVESVLRHIRWLKLSPERLAGLKQEMREHGLRLLFVTKLTSSFVIPTLIAAGLARLSKRQFLGAVLPGECIRTGGLVLLGYYLGVSLKQWEVWLQVAALAGAAVVVSLLTSYFWRRQSS